jgi:hypothetical protein
MIFSHVLYQLSYPGIAAASASPDRLGQDRRAMGSAPMTKRGGLGKVESSCRSFVPSLFDRERRARQSVAVVEPFDQVAVAAAGPAEGQMLGMTGLAADRALGALRID